MTTPTDYYFTYIPQKSGEIWNYKDSVCQNNKTMCPPPGELGAAGAIAGAIIGGIFGCCCITAICLIVVKPMFTKPK